MFHSEEEYVNSITLLTKIFRKESNANNIEAKGDYLSHDHIDMPDERDEQRAHFTDVKAYHIVISSATIISSLRISAVNDIDTICKNSFSKRTSDMIMIAAPGQVILLATLTRVREGGHTLVYTDHKPLEKSFIRQCSAL
jgi:hypothetical protein